MKVDYIELSTQRDRLRDRHIEQLRSFPDIRLSFWAFEQYRTCPQRYILHCVGREPSPPKDNYYAVSGSVVHSLWEDFVVRLRDGSVDWDDAVPFLTDNVPQYYDKFVAEEQIDWNRQKADPSRHRKESIPEIVKSASWVDECLRVEGLIPRDPSTIHNEYTFKTQLVFNGETTPVVLTGRIDNVFVEPAELVIVDTKDTLKRENVDWRQLVWYGLGAEPHFGGLPAKRAGFLFTRLRDKISWRKPYNVHHQDPKKRTFRTYLATEILETALKIRREPFPAHVNRHHCSYCPVQSLCPEWRRYSERSAVLDVGIRDLEEGLTSF